MSIDTAVDVVRMAFWTALLVGGPILCVGFLGGIVVSLVQILTSMQDPGVQYRAAAVSVSGVGHVVDALDGQRLVDYTSGLLGGLDQFAR